MVYYLQSEDHRQIVLSEFFRQLDSAVLISLSTTSFNITTYNNYLVNKTISVVYIPYCLLVHNVIKPMQNRKIGTYRRSSYNAQQ
jgi:hypothetical protein